MDQGSNRASKFRIVNRNQPLFTIVLLWRLLSISTIAAVAESPQTPQPSQTPEQPKADTRQIYIQEYRVQGAHLLTALEVEDAVYPYLGPGRTAEDVDQARAALEKAYQAKGYQTVSVQIPPQQVQGGVVILQVIEGKIGRLRVRGARYYSPEQIKAAAPSLAEGTVPDFNQVSKDIVALNQLPDRRVTPTLRAGVEPDTFDVDLNVQDTLPLHGSLELNNRSWPCPRQPG